MDISALSEATSLDDERNGDLAASPAHESLLSSLSNGVSQAQNGDNKFQSAISAWRNIDLTKLVPELDITASDIISHQKEALLSRKDLAQKTKEFRKLDDASKLVEFKSLVKAYQTFIDLLTNHGKTTSSAFLQLYSSISEAPDPYPLLEASVDAQLLAEDTLPKLNAENEHLQKAVVNLSNLLDDSESKLGEERSARKEAEDSRDSKLKEVEVTWKAVVEEKRDNWEAKERSLEEKIESQDRLINELKASFEVAQRLGHANSQGESFQNSASLAELEIVSSDLDKTSQRLAEVEARNEQLRLELAEASSNILRNPVIEDPVNERLRSENSSLLRKLETVRLEKESETRKRENRIHALERDAQKLLHDKESLRERLHSWRDYSDIQRELEIFKSVEFATLDDDETVMSSLNDGDGNKDNKQEDSAGKDNKKETLEQLLLARNKKMSNEMALLRVSHQNLQQQLGSLQQEISTTNAELEQAQNLNAVLEADLAKVQQEASNNFPSSAMSTTGTYTSRYPTSSYPGGGRRGRASPTSSIISGFEPQSNSRSTLEAIRAGEAVGGGSGILPMIQAQRDRFKQKNAQLEEDLSKEHRIVSSLRQEIASLQKDNLNLYEKSRYVSTFNRGHQSTSASSYVPGPHSTAIQITADSSSGPSLDRYRSAYEANISPFAAFRGRESSRAYKRMSLPERIVYSITRMVLATRTSRNLFAAYCFALHVLIFVMLYWMQSADIVKHASKLSDAASVVVAGGPIAGNRGTDGQHGEWHQEGFTADDR